MSLTMHGYYYGADFFRSLQAPSALLAFPAQDFRKISLGHPVFLFRCSPCLNTYVQSHCVFRVLIAVCFPLDGTGLHHLTKAHPLNTPPLPNPLHAVALQRKTGLILGLKPYSRPPHGVPGNQPPAVSLDGSAGRSTLE